jgi:hypothetical protein
VKCGPGTHLYEGVGSAPGRINRIDTTIGSSSLFGATAGYLLWMSVTGKAVAQQAVRAQVALTNTPFDAAWSHPSRSKKANVG